MYYCHLNSFQCTCSIANICLRWNFNATNLEVDGKEYAYLRIIQNEKNVKTYSEELGKDVYLIPLHDERYQVFIAETGTRNDLSCVMY